MLKSTLIDDTKVNPIARPESIGIEDYSIVLLCLSIIGAFVYYLNIETAIGLFGLIPFVAVGFAIHALLPLAYRLRFFFFLTVAAVFQLFGWKDGSALLIIGLGLWSIVKLPLSVRQRTRIAVVAAIVLAALLATGYMPAFSGPVIPVVGSIFMFRMILYLYEQRFQQKPQSVWMDLNYFFLLPNLIFFIFPVVDYKTFTSRHYAKPAFETYRKGIIWMINGVIHLLLYRIIYYYLIPAPSEILNIYDLLQFLAASYALIVRLAGIFHFSAGVICLFGFDLPPTFNHYFFAQSFSDLWRRINIYWRDFIMKVFYYPVYFKIKHLGPIRAMFITVLIIFVINWFLHGYQWFWIRGQFPLTIQDAVFWGVFGIAVALNSIVQARTRKKRLDKDQFYPAHAIRTSLNVLGIFLFMAVLWSFWTTNDIREWWQMMLIVKTISLVQLVNLILGLMVLITLGTGIQYLEFSRHRHNRFSFFSPARTLFASTSVVAVLAVLAMPGIHPKVDELLATDTTPIIKTKLNAADQENLFKGYYETLLPNNNPMANQIESLKAQMPDSWKPLRALKGMVQVDDIRLKELRPNLDLLFKEAPFTTNAFGMHAPEITPEKAPGTFRVGLLGGSIELGGGVPLEQNMAQVAEAILNRKTSGSNRTFEVLNFAVTGYHLPEQVKVTELFAKQFDIDALVFTAHTDELRRLKRSLYKVVEEGHQKNYPELDAIIHKADAEKTATRGEFERRIDPFLPEIYEWGLQAISRYCQANEITPVWAYVFVPDSEARPEEEFSALTEIAKSQGFRVTNLYPYIADLKEEDLMLAPWDSHLSAEAHRRYGEGLAESLAKIIGAPVQ
ncbi:MAG: hypothetical protein RIC19_17870 [Phaeodactylibacter sp.]|uniref:hypothetical protein n=1 Tax=Phaeodactylibacter sp. TaxID=1940289 RepID=UPI0032EFF15D